MENNLRGADDPIRLRDCDNAKAPQRDYAAQTTGAREVPIGEVKLKDLYYRLHHIGLEEQKLRRAIGILERHPEFAEFIELMHSGLV